VEILCTGVWRWKNETCWNCSRNGGRKRGMMEGVSSLWYILRTFVNVTMYPKYNNNFKKG
jgi:hypothetical protein